MGNNHYQMSERATAQLEIDYLRDEVKKLKEQLSNDVFAKATLRKNGYFVENLWSVHDVTDRYDCSPEDAQEVLNSALTNEYITEQIFLTIDDTCNELNIKLVENV